MAAEWLYWQSSSSHYHRRTGTAPFDGPRLPAVETMDAQLRLYREGLDLLHPEQVLYMDTVSLIYKWSPGLPELPTGPFLGKLKKELDDKDTIVEFATAGPKTYGFRTHLRTLKCKVRGFRLNIPASNNWISTSSNRTSSRKASDLKTSQLILYLLI